MPSVRPELRETQAYLMRPPWLSAESQRESARLFAEAVTVGVKRAAKKVR